MKRLTLLAALSLLAGPATATPDAGLAAITDVGQLNGQALACGEMAVAAEAKKLVIRHAPKTRRYGQLFEEETNAAFLSQGKGPDPCPTATAFSDRLGELAKRLQVLLPAAAPTAQ